MGENTNKKEKLIQLLEQLLEKVKQEPVEIIRFEGNISQDTLSAGVDDNFFVINKSTGIIDYNLDIQLYDPRLNELNKQ